MTKEFELIYTTDRILAVDKKPAKTGDLVELIGKVYKVKKVREKYYTLYPGAAPLISSCKRIVAAVQPCSRWYCPELPIEIKQLDVYDLNDIKEAIRLAQMTTFEDLEQTVTCNKYDETEILNMIRPKFSKVLLRVDINGDPIIENDEVIVEKLIK